MGMQINNVLEWLKPRLSSVGKPENAAYTVSEIYRMLSSPQSSLHGWLNFSPRKTEFVAETGQSDVKYSGNLYTMRCLMLTRLEIDGFKSFRNFAINFQPFQVLIGPNGVGKTNLFDAIV